MLILATLSLALPATWIVDRAGLGTHTDLPDAVAASSPGDTILIRDGSYSGAVIPHALYVRGQGPSTSISGRLEAQLLQGPGELVLSDFTIRAVSGRWIPPQCNYLTFGYIIDPGGIALTGCTLPITLRNLVTAPGATSSGGGRSLLVNSCSNVIMDSCSFERLGPLGYSESGPNCPRNRQDFLAATLWNSNITMFRTRFTGPDGTYGSYACDLSCNCWAWLADSGGPAVQILSGTVVASECEFIGGNGGNLGSVFYWCPYTCQGLPGNGGHGVVAGNPTILDHDSLFVGGMAGTDTCRPGPPGVPGLGISGGPLTTYVHNPHPLAHVASSGAATPGGILTLDVAASSSTLVALWIGGAFRQEGLPSLLGRAYLDPSSWLFHIHMGIGPTTVQLRLENDPSLLGLYIHIQALEYEPSSQAVYLGGITGDVIS